MITDNRGSKRSAGYLCFIHIILIKLTVSLSVLMMMQVNANERRQHLEVIRAALSPDLFDFSLADFIHIQWFYVRFHALDATLQKIECLFCYADSQNVKIT